MASEHPLHRPLAAVALAAAALLCGACSADATTPSEPDITTPGAFVAYEEVPGQINLFRTITTIPLTETFTFIIVDIYTETASSYDGAKELARSSNLNIKQVSAGINLYEFKLPYEVVWYRSLTQGEKGNR